jgi:hypothetical protein
MKNIKNKITENKTTKNKTNKKGNIEILFLTLVIFFLMVVFSVLYILYVQINTFVYPIKQDLFYIVQNAYLSLNKDELSYYNYDIDEYVLNDKVAQVIKLNYDDVNLESLKYNKNTKNVEVIVNIKIKPIVLSNKIGNITLKVKDNIKLKMMEVK